MFSLNENIEEVHRELGEIRQVKKCASCECFVDVLEMMKEDLYGIGIPQAQAMLADMQQWLEKGPKKRHPCLGCEVCLPVEPLNRLAILPSSREQSLIEPDPGKMLAPSPCGCDDT